MKHLHLKLLAIILFGICLTGLQAQEAIPAAGGEATGGGGSVSYSVGQLVFNTYTGEDGSVAQGVQQPYEISIITAIEEADGIGLYCTAYPNPATDFLSLKVENFSFNDLTYYLFDINGKILITEKVTDITTTINLSEFQQGTYFLKVISKKQEVKTFAIIKN